MESAQTQRKGLSKGCLVALIIGVALAVLVIIGVLAVWYYWDDLMKTSSTQLVNQFKTVVAENPPEGVDTVYVNAVADGFSARLEEDEEVDLERFGQYLQTMQQLAGEERLDADMIQRGLDAMIDYYPELEELGPPDVEEEMPPEPVDSLGGE